MGLFSRRPRLLPPTEYGYQPPEGAVGVTWACPSDDCGRGGPEFTGERWPSLCPDCGVEVRTARLAEPWHHEALRIELDARLNGRRPAYGDPGSARIEDLTWHFTDALRSGRPEFAASLLPRWEAAIAEVRAADPYYVSGVQRWKVIDEALAMVEVGLAAACIEGWCAVADFEDVENDNTRRTDGRMLAVRLIQYVEDPRTEGHPARPRLLTELHRIMPLLKEVATGEIETGYARLTRR